MVGNEGFGYEVAMKGGYYLFSGKQGSKGHHFCIFRAHASKNSPLAQGWLSRPCARGAILIFGPIFIFQVIFQTFAKIFGKQILISVFNDYFGPIWGYVRNICENVFNENLCFYQCFASTWCRRRFFCKYSQTIMLVLF